MIAEDKPTKPENRLITQLKRLDTWLGRLFFGKNIDVQGASSFKGDLGMKVIRANPTKRQSIIDYIRGHR